MILICPAVDWDVNQLSWIMLQYLMWAQPFFSIFNKIRFDSSQAEIFQEILIQDFK